jgi:peptide/nickel transport system substrate-binding protein
MTSFESAGNVSRRQILKAAAAGVVTLAGADLLAACGGSGSGTVAGGGTSAPATSPGPPTGGTPVRGGTLRVGMPTSGAAETINPLKAISNVDFARCTSLYDTLFLTTVGGGYKPGLAEEAHSNANATKWTFTLRKGVTFHDGSPMTADDVVFTVKASWGSKLNPQYPGLSQFIDFKGARKIDKYTVEIPLNRGLAEFPAMCTQLALVIVKNGTTNLNNANGTGPFILSSFTPGTSSIFKANPHYWDHGVPYVDALEVVSSFTSAQAQLNALLAGSVDIAPGVTQALAKANASEKRIVLGDVNSPGFLTPTMRLDKPPFTDVRVRKAMRLLAQRPTIVETALDGYGRVGNDLTGETLKYFASDFSRTYDPEQAKSLLKSAGQEKLTVDLYSAELIGGVNEVATAYAQGAAAGGVTVNVRTSNPATYYSAGSPGGTYPNKTFSMNQWVAGMPCMSYLYLVADLPGAPYNETGWGNPSANKLLYDAMGETDEANAKDKWHAVQTLQYEEGGYIIPDNLRLLDAYSTKVRGVESSGTGPCANFYFTRGWLAS